MTYCVTYTRDSGGDTQDLSTTEQLSALQAYAQQNNLLIVQTYTDAARPGSSVVARTAFLTMIEDLRAVPPPATALLVWDWSRFARAIDDAQYYRSDLRRRGITILSISDPIPAGSMGRLFEAAIDWKNQQYLEDLSANVKRGLNHLVTQIGAIGGTPPRGFTTQQIDLGRRRDGAPHIVHRWIPDPDLVPLVQQAFQMRAAGQSYKAISHATRLYQTSGSWQHFFANRIYIGELIFGDQVVPNYCTPIIDLEIFENVQIINTRRLHKKAPAPILHPRTVASKYLLTGLIKCARCGHPMVGTNIHNRRKNHTAHYYQCTAKKRHLAQCDSALVPQPTIENAVLDALANELLQPALLEYLRSQYLQTLQDKSKSISATTRQLKTQLAATHRKIANLAAAIAEKGHSTALLDLLTQTEATAGHLSLQIKQQEQLAALPASLPHINLEDIAARLRKRLQTADTSQRRVLLHQLIQSITVERTPTNIIGEIAFYFPVSDLSDDMAIDLSRRPGPFYIHILRLPISALPSIIQPLQ